MKRSPCRCGVFRLLSAVAALIFFSAPVVAANAQGTLAKISRAQSIVIGYRDSAPPYAFVDRDQHIVGYTIDVCKRVVSAIVAKIGKPLDVRYVPTEASTRIPLVANGLIDLDCGNAVMSQARMRQVDFSLPIYFSRSRFAVPRESAVTGLEALGGRRLTVVQGTNADWHFSNLLEHRHIDLRLMRLRSASDAILSLTSGRSDAFAGDEVALAALTRNNPQAATLKLVGAPFLVNSIGLMLRRDDSEFRLLVNATVSELIRTGELARFGAKWMGPLGIEWDPALERAFSMLAIPPV